MMFRNKVAPRSQPFLLLLLAGALAAASTTPLFAQDALMGWSIENPSTSIALVEVKESEGRTRFVFQNNSDKHVTGLSVSYGDLTTARITHNVEYFGSGESVSPGATCDIEVDSHNFTGRDRVLRLAAVIFEDGTWEGDQEEVLFRGGKRLGLAAERERVNRVLAALVEQGPSDATIAEAKTRIGDLPDSTEEAIDSVSEIRLPGLDVNSIRSADKSLQEGFSNGIHIARSRALAGMSQLANPPNVVQTQRDRARSRALAELREFYRVESARTRELLQQNRGLQLLPGEVGEK